MVSKNGIIGALIPYIVAFGVGYVIALSGWSWGRVIEAIPLASEAIDILSMILGGLI